MSTLTSKYAFGGALMSFTLSFSLYLLILVMTMNVSCLKVIFPHCWRLNNIVDGVVHVRHFLSCVVQQFNLLPSHAGP